MTRTERFGFFDNAGRKAHHQKATSYCFIFLCSPSVRAAYVSWSGYYRWSCQAHNELTVVLLIKSNAIRLVRVDTGVCLGDNCTAYSDLSSKTNDCASYV